MKRRAAVALTVSLLLGACQLVGGQQPEEELILEHLSALERSPHSFEYREHVDGRELMVQGVVEDDFRRRGTVSIDGAEVLEVILSDDAIAVRAVDPEQVTGADALEDPVAIQALREGRWVLDHAAAPELFPPTTREGTVAIGLGPFLDTLYLFDYLERGITDGAGMWEQDPDNINYNPADDVFLELTEELSRDRGYRRFEVIPPPLPGRADRGTEAAVPATPHFRKLSFFLRGQQIVRIVEEISLERQEFRRARAGRESEYYLELLESVREGFVRDPMRLRRMSYEIRDLGSEVSVALPVDDTETGSLAGLFDPDGITELAFLGLELDAEIRPEGSALPAGLTGEGPGADDPDEEPEEGGEEPMRPPEEDDEPD